MPFWDNDVVVGVLNVNSFKNIRLMNLANGIYSEEVGVTIQYLETL